MTTSAPSTAATKALPGTLALLGGPPAVSLPDTTRWPLVTQDERSRVLSVLESGVLVSDRNQVTAVDELENRWAEYVGAAHSIGVCNGTVALQLALAALGVGPGDEVVVPALSFVATAMAVANQGARPVFADIDPHTFNITAEAVENVLTTRTTAVMPVHLHGLPAPMDEILDLSRRRGLRVVEDAAQAHGATIHGRSVGTLGELGAFSLQATKNLPTCGEGGLIVTSDDTLAHRIRRLRQFGETIEAGEPRRYVSHEIGWNAKLSAVQAAFTCAQLDRFNQRTQAQRHNVAAFLERLAPLVGLFVPTIDRPGVTHAWHILRFRLDPTVVGLDASEAASFREAVHRLLRAEGVPLTRYQLMPLADQPAFGSLAPTRAPQDFPHTRQVLEDSLVLQRRHLDPSAGPLLQQYADAFEKVWDRLDIARTLVRRSAR